MNTKKMSRLLASLLSLVMIIAIMPMTAFAAGTPLDTPTNLRWDGTVAEWDAVADAGYYNIAVFKDGAVSTDAEASMPSFDLLSIMQEKGNGTYTFSVQAIPAGTDIDHQESEASAISTDSYVYSNLLAFTDNADYDIPAGTAGISYTSTTALTATGGTGPYIFTVETPITGLSINSDNKLVYARPATATASTTATIKVTDSAATPATATIEIAVGEVSSTHIFVGSVYATLTAPAAEATPPTSALSGESGKYSVSVYSWYKGGTIHVPGAAMGATETFIEGDIYILELTFTPKTGYKFDSTTTAVINSNSTTKRSGTDSVTGAYDFRVAFTATAASDALTFEDKAEYDIPTGTVGIIYTSSTPLTAAKGTAPYTFTIETPVAGLSINSDNKLVYARPATDTAATTATIRVTDSAATPASVSIEIAIGAVTTTPTPLTFADSTDYDIPAGTVSTSYTSTTALSATGGTGSYTFSIQTPVTGLSINSNNRLVYARPATATAAATATIKVTDSAATPVSATIIIAIGEVTDPIPHYQIIHGANGKWTKGGTLGLTFTSDAPFENFTAVEVDDVVIDATYYTTSEGSTIITLKASYLETLSVGSHKISIVSGAGSATTNFTVKAVSGNPITGDNMFLWIVLLFVVGGAVTVLLITNKRMKANNNN